MTFTATDTHSHDDYTQEQSELVVRVLSCPTRMYYEILGLPQLSSTDDVKKQYRLLCLQLHPDKNKHPKAEEAFKIVGQAYAVLSDEEKKLNYDTVELAKIRRRKLQKRVEKEKQKNQQNSSKYSENIPKQRRRPYSHFKTNIQRTDNDYSWVFYYLFGILFIIMCTFPVWSYIFSSEENFRLTRSGSEEYFRLTRSGDFTEQRLTTHYRIPYFVKKGFLVKIEDLYEFERKVETTYARKIQLLKKKYGYT